MSLSQPWQLSDIRLAVREELLDSTGKWWSDSELNLYIIDHENELQSIFEFVWTTSTYTMFGAGTGGGGWGQGQWGSSTFAQPVSFGGNASPVLSLSNLNNILRLDAVYFTAGGTDTNTFRLSPRSIEDLDRLQFGWRQEAPLLNPELVFQVDSNNIQFWPPPPGAGIYIFEYPVLLTYTTDTSTMQIPSWCRYDTISYCAYRALSRFGPNQDLPRAARYKKRHDNNIKRFRRTYDAYFPEHAAALRPGLRFAGRILNPRQNRYQVPGSGGLNN